MIAGSVTEGVGLEMRQSAVHVELIFEALQWTQCRCQFQERPVAAGVHWF